MAKPKPMKACKLQRQTTTACRCAPAIPRGKRRTPPSRRIIRWCLVALTCGGLLERLLWLGRRALNNEEALQFTGVQTTTWNDLIRHCAYVDFHPPLSYLIEKLFYHLNPSLWCLRAPSALCGAAVIPLTYWALRPLTGRLVALAASAATTVSFQLLWYSREARDYSQFYMLSVLSFGFFMRATAAVDIARARPWLIGFVLSTVLSVYSSFFTYLLWPVFGVMLLAIEWQRRGWRGMRWPFIGWFALAGLAVVLLAIPTFRWFAIVNQIAPAFTTYRPALSLLIEKLAPFGFGFGWREIVWAIGLAAGTILLWHRRRLAGLLVTIWTFAQPIGYLYVVGMPGQFTNTIRRYELPLVLGIVALQGAVAAWSARACLPRRALRQACVLATALPILFSAALLAPVYAPYYRLRASGPLYGEMTNAFEKLENKMLLLYNYYEIQFLRFYLPADLRLASPPVFNNPPEYNALDVAGYIRRVLERSPLTAFYDMTSHGTNAYSHADWSWIEPHFAHRLVLDNQDGATLERRGMNLNAWPSNLGGYTPLVYWNNRCDLPAWHARRGESLGVTIGPEWFVLPCAGEDGVHRPVPVLDGRGTLCLYNGARTNVPVCLQFALAACAPEQRVHVWQTDGVDTFVGPFGVPMQIVGAGGGQPQIGYAPLAALARQRNGLLPLPNLWRFTPTVYKLSIPACKPGLTDVYLQPANAAGVALLDLSVQPAPPEERRP